VVNKTNYKSERRTSRLNTLQYNEIGLLGAVWSVQTNMVWSVYSEWYQTRVCAEMAVVVCEDDDCACFQFWYTSCQGMVRSIILLHVHPLLGNVLVNKSPRRPIIGEQSVAGSRNNIWSCVSVSAVTTQQWIVTTWLVFSVDPTGTPIGWLDNDYVISV
jgi:hypothetical protein